MKKVAGLFLFCTVLFFVGLNVSSSYWRTYWQTAAQSPVQNFSEEKPLIEGIVSYPNGKPASDAVIYAYGKEESPFSGRTPSTISSENGKFTMQLKMGEYQLCAWKQSENYLLPNFLTFGLPVGGKCEIVVVPADKKIQLSLGPKSNSLEGQIVDFKNVFLSKDATVILYRPLKLVKNKWVLTSMEEATWDARAETKPDENGEFIFNGLPEGTYFLRIEIQGHQPWFYKKKNLADQATPIEIKNNGGNKIAFSYY